MQDSPEYDVNYKNSVENNNSENSNNNNTENTVDITEFSKILIDFLNSSSANFWKSSKQKKIF